MAIPLGNRELDVGTKAVMVAQPDAVHRHVEDQFGISYRCSRLWMSVPAPEENIIHPAAVPWLPHNLANCAGRVGVFGGPGQARSITGDGPCIVIVYTPAFKRLEAR